MKRTATTARAIIGEHDTADKLHTVHRPRDLLDLGYERGVLSLPENLGRGRDKNLDTALDDIADVEIPSKFADFTSSLPDDHTYAGATLSLKSETTLSLYFTKDRTLSDISCVDKDGIARTVQTKTTDSYQIIRIRNIAAMELQDDYTVSFKINGTAHSITYSPMNYCCKVLNGSTENPNLQKLVKALYQYSQAANLYFGQEG